MLQATTPILVISALLLCLLSGCGGSSGIRVTEGDQQIGAAPTGSLFYTTDATIVHVDESERLATLRNARSFAEYTFLETRNIEGIKSATLKTRPSRDSGLRTADILEGMPKINDRATPVGADESVRLSKIYRDPVEE
jgi:hypothetical protein